MKHLFFYFLVFTFSLLSAQLPEYTLPAAIDTLIKQGEDCLKNKQPQCKLFFEQALKEARELDKDSLEALTFYSVGSAFYRSGTAQDLLDNAKKAASLDGSKHPLLTHCIYQDIFYAYSDLNQRDSLLHPAQESLRWAEVANDISAIAASYIHIATALQTQGNHKEAIQTLLDARPIVKASGDIHRESGLLLTLGNIYRGNHDYELAEDKYKEAAQGFLKAQDSSMYASAISNWAVVANELGKTKEVIHQLEPLMRFFNTNQDRGIIYATTQLGEAYLAEQKYAKAAQVFIENIDITGEQGNHRMNKVNKKNLAVLYLEKNEGEKALQVIAEVYESERNAVKAPAYYSTLQIYGDALTMTKQGQKAGPIYQEYIKGQDSLFNQTKEKEIARMRETFEADKREAQIALLEKEKETNRLQKRLLGVSLLAVLGILGGLWVRFRESRKRAILQREKLDAEIEHKQKELTSQALNLAKKNETLIGLKEKIAGMEKTTLSQDLLKTIDFDVREDKGWEVFMQSFQEVHKDFHKNIQQAYPEITAGELRLMSLLKMNLNSKEIGSMLNISQEGVMKARYRLRKKLNLTKEDSLEKKILAL